MELRASQSDRFKFIADASQIGERVSVSSKDALQHIARDVSNRLSVMRRKIEWADWRMALRATQTAHPEWFRHGETAESLELSLREAGVDMSIPEKPFGFVGTISPDK